MAVVTTVPATWPEPRRRPSEPLPVRTGRRSRRTEGDPRPRPQGDGPGGGRYRPEVVQDPRDSGCRAEPDRAGVWELGAPGGGETPLRRRHRAAGGHRPGFPAAAGSCSEGQL